MKRRSPTRRWGAPSGTSRFIDRVTGALGHPAALAAAVSLVAGWLVVGPAFHFSDTYQLVINTATSVITFIMVFAIQHTTNRETRAINLKLDELLEAMDGANEKLVGVETRSEATIKQLQEEEAARAHGRGSGARGSRSRQSSTDSA